MTTKQLAQEAAILFGGNGLSTQQAMDALERLLDEHTMPPLTTTLANAVDGSAHCALARAADKNLQMLDKKQADYGDENLKEYGFHGVMVRMSDKMARIKNLLRGDLVNVPARVDEAIDDTLLDLSNYALIAYVMRRKIWPGPEVWTNK